MIISLQLIAIVFALIMIYFAHLHYMRGELNRNEIISWWMIWVVTIIITIFPGLLREFASTFLITRVFDLMVIGGFILVIFMSYKSYVRTKNLERKVDDFVRQEALKDIKNDKSKK